MGGCNNETTSKCLQIINVKLWIAHWFFCTRFNPFVELQFILENIINVIFPANNFNNLQHITTKFGGL